MGRHRFREDLKRKIIAEHLQGGRAVAELCRQYNVSDSTFYRWLEQHQIAEEVPAGAAPEALARQLWEAQQQVEDLQAALGRSAMEVDFLKRSFKRAGLPFPSGPRA